MCVSSFYENMLKHPRVRRNVQIHHDREGCEITCVGVCFLMSVCVCVCVCVYLSIMMKEGVCEKAAMRQVSPDSTMNGSRR